MPAKTIARPVNMTKRKDLTLICSGHVMTGAKLTLELTGLL